ncbi:MAG TPA: tRNA (adenosine(37)-N6)-threonylcarbamoyltransferase complex dimerization subunit type 1 TsaB [Bacteroidales bacterium]|nr:tRNA (adenosine(37)-N6)-threonylcarbamoyltransferase complex dimerization subunit type 1 TsaB [Bacteroidales bacterium]
MIICIETATNLCSVALCDSSGVLSLRESNDQRSHSSMLTVYIGEILKETSVDPSGLEAVAVSKGPGSYTGLRIGVSVAKGIAFAASIPLIGIETTLSMFIGMKERFHKEGNTDGDTMFCPMLDARRMEVYYAMYDLSGNRIKEISAEIITENSFSSIPDSQNIIFFGDGALKCKNIIKRKNSAFVDDFEMSAANMKIPAIQALESGHFENVAYFEPFYLKDFITTTQRKNILG